MNGQGRPACYEIWVEGGLDSSWAAWFDGLQVTSDGGQTLICGLILDQPALHGLLTKIRDLGLCLTSLHRHETGQAAELPQPSGGNVKITIVAATGGIGRHLLEQAVAAHHDVTAVVRNPRKLSRQVRTVPADLAHPDPAALESAVAGADAVLSGLGPRSNAEAGVASLGTRAIVTAMQATGTRRIVVVSAAPVGTVPSPGRPHPPQHDPGDGFFMRHLFSPLTKAALRKTYADLAEMEDILRGSGLDWTVIRPARLTDKPPTGAYRTAIGHNLPHGLFTSRADVAGLMLAVLNQPDTIGRVIGIAN
jgi:nucleoside-diphosphate-sugar epimerase